MEALLKGDGEVNEEDKLLNQNWLKFIESIIDFSFTSGEGKREREGKKSYSEIEFFLFT